jgi:uncharacterized protein (DUF1778 family)
MPTRAKLKHIAVKRESKRTKSKRAQKPAKAGLRSARIEARTTPENLAVIKRAAEIEGRSVSDFIVASAQEAAHRRIEETQIIRLSVEDQRLIAEALINPPEPTPALIRAFETHRRLFGPTR